MDKMYDDIRELIDCELEAIAKKSELSEQDVANLYKMIDVVKDIEEIKSMEMGGGYSGKSYNMPYWGSVGFDDGQSYGSRMRYNQGNMSGRNYANNGGRSSYGRSSYGDDMRMMPGQREW